MSTRPDILFATSKASRKNKDPTYEDWINVLKIFRYLKETKYYGLGFTNNINLNVYVDADLGGDEKTKRSTIGFIINMGNTPNPCIQSSNIVYQYQLLIVNTIV